MTSMAGIEIIDLKKIQVNGKNIFLVGSIHDGKLDFEGRTVIETFLPPTLNPKNTLVVSEGDGFVSLSRFEGTGSAPKRFGKHVLVKADTLQTWLTAGYLWRKSEKRNERNYLSTDKWNILLRQNNRFRDFLYALAIKRLSVLSKSPQNLVFFVGAKHIPSLYRFLVEEKYYERYQKHLLELAPKATKKQRAYEKYLDRQKRRVARKMTR